MELLQPYTGNHASGACRRKEIFKPLGRQPVNKLIDGLDRAIKISYQHICKKATLILCDTLSILLVNVLFCRKPLYSQVPSCPSKVFVSECLTLSGHSFQPRFIVQQLLYFIGPCLSIFGWHQGTIFAIYNRFGNALHI